MKEQYKSILLAVVSGIVACVVCAGVVFILPTNNSTLKGNEDKLPNNQEEINLGDICGSWTADGPSRVVDSIGNCSSAAPTTGTTWCKLINTYTTSAQCQDEGVPNVNTCYEVQDQTRTCSRACEDYESVGDCPSSCYTYDNGCHTNPAPAPVVTCSNKTYNGQEQSIATCNIGIISNHRRTDAGSQTVTCTYGDQSDSKGCSISKATPDLNFNGATLHVGENQVLSATTSPDCNSNITYFTQGGGSVIIEDGHAVAISVGSTTIRAISQENSNCNQATKDVVITVTPAENTKACYRLVANQCSSTLVQAETCDNASNYYDTIQECNAHVVLCSAGEGYDPGSHRCMTCSAGYYSPENDGVCHQCGPNEFSSSGSASCTTITAPCCKNPYGNATELTTLAECQAAVSSGVTVSPGRCSARAVASVTASYTGTVYLNASEYNYDNGVPDEAGQYGFKTVTYTAVDEHGHVIDSSRINWSTNVTGSVASVVSATVNSSSYVVTYKGRGCVRGTSEVSATATGINGISGSKTSPSMTIKVNEYTRWRQSNWNAENSNNWPLLADGVDHEQCNSVSDPYEENGVTKYRYRYNRCGCGGGTTTYSFCCVANDGSNYNWLTGQSSKTCPSGYTIDTTKTSATCLKTYACYKDSNNSVHWTSMPEASWVRVDKPESECKDQEACFENPAGTRLWGKFYDQIVNGYKLITTIKDPATCLYPTEEDACYVNNDDPTDYRWASTALDGYTKLEGVTDVDACQPELCYINKEKNEFEFGKFKNNDNYIPVYKTIEKDGAYVDVLISDIKECTTEVPVPPTALDVSKLVYVFMGILMACGIAFIYYSTVTKKQNQ